MQENRQAVQLQVSVQANCLDAINELCASCGALYFAAEKTSNHYCLCCLNGKVNLPFFPSHAGLLNLIQTRPEYLKDI